ncbi:MAG TPA: isoprenylcysteine carboxylmethyltransferase family protein, partial [Thermoanaerobaculia bacterium]|nr:isoprenylcysteine carboxylmethyltransferase family protein [Thermoanaerobaculia bacterium]
MKTLFIALRAALYGTGFVLLWGWLAVSARAYDRRFHVSVPPSIAPLGLVVMGLGALLALGCITTFVQRGRGTAAPFDPPRVFVASGPYRFVRNPMYLGAWLLLAGYGLFEVSVSILSLSFVMLLAAHLFVVVVEEPGLETRFGKTYREYRA